MVENALRGVVREALSYIAEHGRPGRHHFYITFRTATPGVVMPEILRERFPEEMTVVLEHEFDDLRVTAETIAVTLYFQRRPERLTIPFAAITAFADPSVKFGLQFPAGDEAEAGAPAKAGPERARRDAAAASAEKAAVPLIGSPGGAGKVPPEKERPPAKKKPGEVVTLDTFRKK